MGFQDNQVHRQPPRMPAPNHLQTPPPLAPSQNFRADTFNQAEDDILDEALAENIYGVEDNEIPKEYLLLGGNNRPEQMPVQNIARRNLNTGNMNMVNRNQNTMGNVNNMNNIRSLNTVEGMIGNNVNRNMNNFNRNMNIGWAVRYSLVMKFDVITKEYS